MPRMEDPLEGQDRSDPTESHTDVDIDLQSEETKETNEKRQSGDFSVEDIENDELREKVMAAREQADQEGQQEDDEQTDDTGGDTPDGEVNRVQVEQGESPLEAIANDMDGDATDEANAEAAAAESAGQAMQGAAEQSDGGLMSGVDDEDVEEAMDMDLNVVEDVDPEHFNFEGQDFSVFGGYGEDAVVDHNGVYFHFVQPDDDTQEELVNSMGGGMGGSAMTLTGMMEAVIEATVAEPQNIDEIIADWSPFEKMGLGMQCMEFLGLNSLGNI